MKKRYSILIAAVASVACIFGGAAAVSDDGVVTPADNDWVNFAASGNTGGSFARSTSNKPDGATYGYSVWNTTTLLDKNLWLSTPALDLTAGVPYKFEMKYQTWSTFQVTNFEIYLADSQVNSDAVAENVASLTPIYKNSKLIIDQTKNTVSISVDNVKATSTSKYLVFHISGKCSGRFSIGDVKFTPAIARPLAPTNLAGTPQGEEIAVNLTWTLPTENSLGGALTGDDAITAVEIYRDDEKIATLEGAQTAFVDSEATGLTKGSHTYCVAAVAGNVVGAKSAPITVSNIGPWDFSQNSLTLDTSTSPSPDAWTRSTNNTSLFMRVMSSPVPPETSFTNLLQAFCNASLPNVDAWFSSPRIDAPKGKTVKVSFYLRYNPNIDTEISEVKAYLSTVRATESAEAAAAAKTGEVIFEESVAKGSISSNEKWKQIVVKGIQVENTPLYLNLNMNGTVCKGLYITGLQVEPYVAKPFMPAAPNSLTAAAAANQKLEVTLNWINPKTDVEGESFTASQTIQNVYIYRDDFETPIATLEGVNNNFKDTEETGLTPGAHAYKVKVKVADTMSDFSNEAKVEYVGPATMQSLPWNPSVVNISNDMFKTFWISWNSNSMAPQWTNRQAGIFLMNGTGSPCGTWLVSAPLDMQSGGGYLVDYTIATTMSNLTPLVEIGIVDSTAPTEFIVSQPVAVDGAAGQCALLLNESTARAASTGEYRLAIRDVTPNPSASYNVIVKALKVSVDPSVGIESVATADAEITAIYDLSGRRVASASIGKLPKGIYIVRYSDGKSRKCIVR